MTTQELVKMVRDSSVSDEVVYDALNKYLSGEEDWEEDEIQNLGKLLKEMRPKVTLQLFHLVLSEHKDCCSGDPT